MILPFSRHSLPVCFLLIFTVPQRDFTVFQTHFTSLFFTDFYSSLARFYRFSDGVYCCFTVPQRDFTGFYRFLALTVFELADTM